MTVLSAACRSEPFFLTSGACLIGLPYRNKEPNLIKVPKRGGVMLVVNGSLTNSQPYGTDPGPLTFDGGLRLSLPFGRKKFRHCFIEKMPPPFEVNVPRTIALAMEWEKLFFIHLVFVKVTECIQNVCLTHPFISRTFSIRSKTPKPFYPNYAALISLLFSASRWRPFHRAYPFAISVLFTLLPHIHQ